jgi:tetratricopeptide (TPR) repeat protein
LLRARHERPGSYAAEKGNEIKSLLQVRPSPLAQVQAITYFARALGAARSGNPDAAKADIAKLGELRDKLREAKDTYWAEQVDIQQKVASAWVLYAEGKYDEALNAMSAAADAEDKTEKHPVTPGVPKPARELYGVMLLERGKPNEALAAFEATLKKEPNRLGAYVGAAKAAEKSGDSAKALTHYEKVVAIAGGADNTRTEVVDARAHLK